MNWQTIFNPFSIFSEKQLAIAGISITITGSLIGSFCNSSFNGTLDMHIAENPKLITVFLENFINISTITLLLFGLGKYFNTKTRFIDILNTAFWYRYPIYILSLLSSFMIPEKINEKFQKNIDHPKDIFETNFEMMLGLLFGLITLLTLAYTIVLLVNGFKTATNTKKWQHWVAFGFTILISEGITQFLIKQL